MRMKWLADKSSDEDFLPYQFSPTKWPVNRKENLLIIRGSRTEIEVRQSVARAPLVDPIEWPSISLIQATREISYSWLPHLPASSHNSTLYSRAHEITSRLVNYRNLARLSLSPGQKAPSNRERRIVDISNRSRFT